MGLISKTVKVKWGKKTKEHYVSLGYKFTKIGDEFEVKVEDLTKGCNAIISYNCDECGEIKECMYKDYVKIKKINGYNYCDKCGHNHRSNSKRKSCKKSTIKEKSTNKVSKNFKKSFYQWCIEHNRQDVLDRWDYELNDYSPNDIGYGSNKKCWFKCDKHTNHKSELKKLDAFTKGQEGSIKCNQCKSIAQYILDNFPNKKLEEVWDFNKNGNLDPWNINRFADIKIWIKCQEKDYHGSYEINSIVFSQGMRCCYCSYRTLHIKDSLGYFIENTHGKEYLDNIWSCKNKKSPYEYSKVSNSKIWIKVEEYGEYKDYPITCHVFVKNNAIYVKKTLYDWCIENNRQDVLDRWDYELNDCSPKDVYCSCGNKWFKCDKHTEHKSELKNVTNITRRNCEIKCNQCNSVAQYILDNFPDKDLYDVWDKEKNGDLDPWKVQRGSGKQKIWIKCQKVDYHGSYYTNAGVFTMGFGCPYCYNKKVHPRDSLGQYIIDNFGEDFLNKIWSDKNKEDKNVLFNYKPCSGQEFWWSCPDEKHEDFLRTCNSSYYLEFRCPVCSKIKKESMYEKKVRVYLETLNYDVFTEHECTIVTINPKSNRPLPFDNEIVLSNGKHLIIEVHGQQHYKVDSYYNETEEDLHYTKLKDRYKRIKCKQAGYEYLEIPYTAFDKKETYKQTINNKIKNILKEE